MDKQIDLQTLQTLDDSMPAALDSYKMMVLLVDDQPMVGEAVRQALAPHQNIDFHYCAYADEALNVAARIKPTVILQDLVMPGIDGLTLVRQYRAHPATHSVPVIVLSAKEDPVVKSAAFAAGVNDYLVKLPDTIELVARIGYHSRFYIHLQQRDAAFRALRESQHKLQETNLELLRLTNTDGLTGIANRRYFDEHLETEWKRAKREKTELSLLLVDADCFKLYNDTYGHVAGDKVLQRIAGTLQSMCRRPADLAARFGGEEFALILPHTTPGGLRLLAEMVRSAVEALAIPHESAQQGRRVTVSCGGATLVPTDNESPASLIEQADRMLYRAKHEGRNRVFVGE